MVTRIISIILCLFLSGCASYTEIYRDEVGRINRVQYSGNQQCKIDVSNDVVEVNNKMDLKLLDVNLAKLSGV
jgi:hypothetical protein